MIKKWQALSLVMLVFLIGVASGAQGTRLVIRQQIQNAIKKGPAGLHDLMMAQLDKQLDLDSGQRQKVAVILSESERDFSRDVQPRMNTIFSRTEYRIQRELKSGQQKTFERSIRQRKQLWSKYDLKHVRHDGNHANFWDHSQENIVGHGHADLTNSHAQALQVLNSRMVDSRKMDHAGLLVGPDGKTLGDHIKARHDAKLGDKFAGHNREQIHKDLALKASQLNEIGRDRKELAAPESNGERHEASQHLDKLTDARHENERRADHGDSNDKGLEAARNARIERQNSIQRAFSGHASGVTLPNLTLPIRR